jgi:hypothetical protein
MDVERSCLGGQRGDRQIRRFVPALKEKLRSIPVSPGCVSPFTYPLPPSFLPDISSLVVDKYPDPHTHLVDEEMQGLNSEESILI